MGDLGPSCLKAVAVVTAAVLSACAHGGAAHEEFLESGDVIVTNLIGFAVMEPQGFKTLVFAHTPALWHPYVGTRPLLLGDVVELVLPANWQNMDLALDDLDPRVRE